MRSPLLIAVALIVGVPHLDAQGATSTRHTQVLPDSMPQEELIALMGSFTRALGVRCEFCHVGSPGQMDFDSDEKVPKQKAREMLRMVMHINDSVLPHLPAQSRPAARVTCFTCHRGLRVPRTLQDTLTIVYDRGGLQGLAAEYVRLRGADYGTGKWNFNAVALVDIGSALESRGAGEDAEAVHELNIANNPTSRFAKQAHISTALERAYRDGVDAGNARWDELARLYPMDAFRESMLVDLGRTFMKSGNLPTAVVILRRVTDRLPDSFFAWDSMGDVLALVKDVTGARTAYGRALALNPESRRTEEKLAALSP